MKSSYRKDAAEFYPQEKKSELFEVMRTRIKEREHEWNYERPHQALNYLTPHEYYEKWQRGRLPTKDIITLQT